MLYSIYEREALVKPIVCFRVGSWVRVSVCRRMEIAPIVAHLFKQSLFPFIRAYTAYLLFISICRCCRRRAFMRPPNQANKHVKKWKWHHKNANVHPFKCCVAYAFRANCFHSHRHLSCCFRPKHTHTTNGNEKSGIWAFYWFDHLRWVRSTSDIGRRTSLYVYMYPNKI